MMVPSHFYQFFFEDYLRILKPGGVLEIWDSDPTFRMLRPHVPSAVPGSAEAEEHERLAWSLWQVAAIATWPAGALELPASLRGGTPAERAASARDQSVKGNPSFI